MMATLLLGSNLGDRNFYLSDSRKRLSAVLGPELSSSAVLETEAVGFDGPPFLNCIVRFDTDVSAERLLEICKRIEREMGRTDEPEYASDGSRIYHDRVIDIDILFYGELEISTPQLTIPHPQVKTRAFVGKLLTL